jgi:hypothetical protein
MLIRTPFALLAPPKQYPSGDQQEKDAYQDRRVHSEVVKAHCNLHGAIQSMPPSDADGAFPGA